MLSGKNKSSDTHGCRRAYLALAIGFLVIWV